MVKYICAIIAALVMVAACAPEAEPTYTSIVIDSRGIFRVMGDPGDGDLMLKAIDGAGGIISTQNVVGGRSVYVVVGDRGVSDKVYIFLCDQGLNVVYNTQEGVYTCGGSR